MTRLPAEWDEQAGVLLTWPHAETDWADDLEAALLCFDAIADTILSEQLAKVLIVCHDDTLRTQLSARFAQALAAGRVCLVTAPVNDSWARDHGPMTVVTGDTPRMIDFRFNAWGGKFEYALDDAINPALFESGFFKNAVFSTQSMVLEGGAVESDGQGTLLMRRSAVITESRNPGLDQRGIEHELRQLLGVDRFLWLDDGSLSGDDTDGHIDTLARFVSPQQIVFCATEDPEHPDFRALQAMRKQLGSFRCNDARPYELQPLPLPEPILDDAGNLLPATYANFLICNRGVLLPVYNDPADARAIDIMQGCFPERTIYPIDCTALIRQHGSLHCVTMQIPQQVQMAC